MSAILNEGDLENSVNGCRFRLPPPLYVTFRDTFALVAPDALASHLFLDSSWLDTLLLLLFFTTHRGASKHASLMQPVSEGVAKVMSQ